MNNEINANEFEYDHTNQFVTKYRNTENYRNYIQNKKDPIYKVLKGEPIKHKGNEFYTLIPRNSSTMNQTEPNYKDSSTPTSEALKESRRNIYNQTRVSTNNNTQFQLKTETSLRA